MGMPPFCCSSSEHSTQSQTSITSSALKTFEALKLVLAILEGPREQRTFPCTSVLRWLVYYNVHVQYNEWRLVRKPRATFTLPFTFTLTRSRYRSRLLLRVKLLKLRCRWVTRSWQHTGADWCAAGPLLSKPFNYNYRLSVLGS